MELKNRFLRVYSSLPLGARKEIVAVLEDPIGPIRWEQAYVEIEHDTPVGDEILKKLEKLQLI